MSVSGNGLVLSAMLKAKQIIGRSDYGDFPELGLKGIRVKVDTGAYTSSISVSDIRIRKFKKKPHLYFTMLTEKHPQYTGERVRFSKYSVKSIRSSNGQVEKRFVIQTHIILFEKRYEVTVSLTDRSSMRFPVLLGRQLIKQGFLVDVSRSYISKKKIKKSKTPRKKVATRAKKRDDHSRNKNRFRRI